MNSTQEKKEDKVKIAFKKIEDNVEEIFKSDNFKSYLKTMSKFHNYSINNSILIYMQKPDATCVAGYNAWKNNFNRNVNKGEKGIAILAPCPYKYKVHVEKKDKLGNVIIDPNTGKPKTEEQETEYLSFKVVNVFDVNQTSGEPLPTIGPELLEGNNDISQMLFSSLRELASEFNVTINFADKDDNIINSGAKGYFSKEEKAIVIDSEQELDQQAKTLVHELAHSVLHSGNTELSREDKEIQAEATAFAVMDHFNLDTSSYSMPYISSWAIGKQPEELKNVLNSILKNTHEIIDRITPIMDEKIKERNASEKAIEDLSSKTEANKDFFKNEPSKTIPENKSGYDR